MLGWPQHVGDVFVEPRHHASSARDRARTLDAGTRMPRKVDALINILHVDLVSLYMKQQKIDRVA